MANSDYFGLANSLSRARRPPAQNDVYMQQPRGTGRPPQQYGSGSSGMFDPNKLRGPNASGFYSNDSIVRGGPQRGGGLGGVAGIDLLGAPGAFQNTMQPPQGGGLSDLLGGMSYGGDARPPAFGGGPTPMPGGGMQSMDAQLGGLLGAGGYQTPSAQPNPMQQMFGGGPTAGGATSGIHMLGRPPGMQVPGFGGGPTMGGNMDPNTSRLARPNVPAFGGGPQPGPQPMMLPPNPYGGPKP